MKQRKKTLDSFGKFAIKNKQIISGGTSGPIDKKTQKKEKKNRG